MSSFSFTTIADEWVTLELAARTTMMGQACLKANGRLFACAGPRDSVVVKLGSLRVQEEIAAGNGATFGPWDTPFKNWVEITHASSGYIRERLLEALEGTAAS